MPTSLDSWASQHSLPWMMMGDLNEILQPEDKEGGRPVGETSSNAFADIVFDHGLLDLGFVGNPFTWSNRRPAPSNVRERLERALYDSDWGLLFPRARVLHLSVHRSDCVPIMLDIEGEVASWPKPFWFEAMWTLDDTSRNVVERAWGRQVNGSAAFRDSQKLKSTKVGLRVWNQSHFGNVRNKLKALKGTLKHVQTLPMTYENVQLEHELCHRIEEEEQRSFMHWFQKARELRLLDKDCNIHFFHLSTIVKRRFDSIEFLKVGGNWIQGTDMVAKEIVHFYKDLFTSEPTHLPEDLDGIIQPIVTEADNELLCTIPLEEEVREVVFSMGSYKAPGPDGFSLIFFKHDWDVIGEEVVESVQAFFREGHLLRQLNHTFIRLIPKFQGAAEVQHFRPLSLCNVSYKIITKILANRLAPLLGKMVSPLQGAFVPGRWIAENIILAKEVVHYMRHKRGEGSVVGFKVDMMKTYNRVDWRFLLKVLECFGFSKKWCNLIHQCITTVKCWSMGPHSAFLVPHAV